jgi:hypothetical protein
VYRPQFAFPAAPEGFTWQPCLYGFDQSNLPALGNLTLATGQESIHIPLRLDDDAPFILRAIKLANSGFNVLLYDPWGNQLMDDYVRPSLYASELPPFTVLEGPGLEVPAGSAFSIRLQGQ